MELLPPLIGWFSEGLSGKPWTQALADSSREIVLQGIWVAHGEPLGRMKIMGIKEAPGPELSQNHALEPGCEDSAHARLWSWLLLCYRHHLRLEDGVLIPDFTDSKFKARSGWVSLAEPGSGPVP